MARLDSETRTPTQKNPAEQNDSFFKNYEYTIVLGTYAQIGGGTLRLVELLFRNANLAMHTNWYDNAFEMGNS